MDQREDPAAPLRRILRAAGEAAEAQFERAASATIPAVVRSVDIDTILAEVDVDAVLDHVDVDRLLDRVDVNRVLDRVDVDRLLDRVDVDRLLDRVGVDRLLDRVDVEAVVGRAQVGDLVVESTSRIGVSALDLARRQAAALDTVVLGVVNRLLRRDPGSLPAGPARLLEPQSEAG